MMESVATAASPRLTTPTNRRPHVRLPSRRTSQSDSTPPVRQETTPNANGSEWTLVRQIVQGSGVGGGTKVRDLSEDEVLKIRAYIDQNYKVEGDLRREVALNVKRLIEIGSYRGLRHRRNLPVRGQRTKTNARQRRGPKKTVGVRRKK